jgi:ABC-2 type transport system permease protein
LLAVRVGLRFALVALTCGMAWLAGCLALSVPLDASALGWLGMGLANLLAWAGVAALVAASCRSVAGSLAAAVGGWVVLVVLLPALLNLGVAAAYPVEEGLALTVKQRQESHSAWDRPRAETMSKFFVANPDWSGTPAVTNRFAWRWYYAMHEVADRSVAPEAAAYQTNLLRRQSWHTRLAWLAPAAYTQLAMDRRAGSDLDAHLAYLNQIRAFHQELRGYFYPLCFAERSLTPAEYADFPRFRPSPVPSAEPVSPLPLLVLATATGWFALRLARRLTIL